MVNIGLGAGFAAGIALTAYLLIDSWGGTYWIFNALVAFIVCLLALLRGRRRAWPAIVGLSVAMLAGVLSLAADLPQEPGPMTALALAVLVGSAIRTLPLLTAAAIAVGGLAVVALAWVSGSAAGSTMATLGWAAAVAAGFGLRAVDRGQGAVRPSPTQQTPQWQNATRTP